ncbi:MAG TPA: hypothetical protein VEJ19_09165 [Nitrososphaerales archaeon]|nr:hypothetical protein [Nitrososphaerales archaeon]
MGTVFFVLVFMMALGSIAYASGLQQQAATAQELELQNAAQRGAESLAFAVTIGGLVATNEGPTTVSVNHVLLRYPNGTVYSIFAGDSIPSGGSTLVQSLVPNGICSPGTATCASKYLQILEGDPPGSSVGLVTGLGNAFWYTDQKGEVDWGSLVGFPARCPAGEVVSQVNTTLGCDPEGTITSWDDTRISSGGAGEYSSSGLAVNLPANGTFAFYAFTVVEPSFGTEHYNFEVQPLPPGASLVVACAPMSDPEGGGNLPTNCVDAAGIPIAAQDGLSFGVMPPVYATPGLFGVVSSGPGEITLQIDFACTSDCGGVSLLAGSFMVVQALE